MSDNQGYAWIPDWGMSFETTVNVDLDTSRVEIAGTPIPTVDVTTDSYTFTCDVVAT